FNGLFSNAINISAVKDKTQELTKNAGTKDEKIKALYDWVRDNIRYEYSEIGIAGGYKPNPTTEVLSYKFGDCKDHTILLISMLKHLDIEAYPALVAYSDFKESDTPSLVFYHSLVAVPNGGKILWLDPTCTSCPYKYIPPSDQGSDAMIIMDNKEGFTRIDDLDVDKKQGIQVTRTVNLTSDGTAVVDYTRRETGYEAVSDAKELKDLNYDKAKEKLKDFINMICDGGELRTYNITSSDTEVGVLTIQMKVNCRKFASTSGEKIIFDLSQEPVFYDAIKEERRVFPIQLDDSITVEYTTNTILPKGYSVESVPEDFKLSESFAEYESRFSTEQGVLHAYTKTGIKEGTIPASKFYEFKKFFTDISANSKKGVILSPEGEQKAVTEASSTPTTVETTIPQATSATTLPEKSQGCTPALPAVITVALSILMGIPYTLMKK
ncbi:MAG: transglutaminase domain-containing protein, partial [Candidatus Altiarchaeales archaeon]|nr:transglutaminase domain-containing protein [Candidatus Altiarchaeales archaeon]